MTRVKLIESAYVLNTIMEDLIVGMRTFPLIEAHLKEKVRIVVNRMCFSHIFLALYKYLEYYDRYSKYIPNICKEECKKLAQTIRERKMDGFRNAVVGHIWNKKTKKPLSANEIDSYYLKIVKDNPESFLLWINSPKNNNFPNTVVSIIEFTRDCLIKENNITKEELFGISTTA